MKHLGLLLLVILMVSCGATRVNYDYDKNTDFTAYTTYGYYADMETGLSQLDERRLMNALSATLQSKGLLFSEEPDMLINIQSTVLRGQANNAVGVGLGGGGGAVGGGISVGIPVGGPNLSREVIIDIVDAKKDLLIWQANSESPFKEGDTPAVKEKKMQELVVKIFEKYPPKSRN
jgi:hypothetical protein